MSTRKTLFDKIWESHVVAENDDGTSLLYIDMHLTHEVTSWPGFESMRNNDRPVRRPDAVLAVPDHVIPTTNRGERIEDDQARVQFETLVKNCADFNVPLIPLMDERQGIVHIIGPEQGATLPGITELLAVLEQLTASIRALDRQLATLATTRYPVTELLR